MDLIFTNAKREDLGVLSTHSFDLSYGATENDFELTLGANEPMLENGACIYIEGTEYGGIVGGIKSKTNSETITYKGRAWYGIINSKVIEPDSGEDYLTVSGDANTVLAFIVDRLELSGLFAVDDTPSGVYISNYQFPRYCKGYDGIAAMLAQNGGKLKMAWKSRFVHLSAAPVADYTDSPVDGDIATLTVEQNNDKVNHLICLGKGDLAEREVIHLYADQYGRIGDEQYYTGIDEVVETYENTNSEDLRSDGIKAFTERRNSDKAEMHISETDGLSYDIGDIVGAKEYKSGIKVAETVTQKIIRIINGVISTEYKTGKQQTGSGSSSSGSGSSGGGNSGGIVELPVANKTTLGGIKVGDNLGITGDGVLSVVTTDNVEQDNTRPMTSAGVYTTVGNIEVLLKTI